MNNKGFTLVEVILAIVILGILAITFIPILSNQYVLIMKTEKKSEATYKTVNEIEKRIIEIEKEKKEKKINKEKYTPYDTDQINIEFTNVTKVELTVDYIEKEIEYRGDKIKIHLGMPLEKESY